MRETHERVDRSTEWHKTAFAGSESKCMAELSCPPICELDIEDWRILIVKQTNKRTHEQEMLNLDRSKWVHTTFPLVNRKGRKTSVFS